MNHIVCGAWLVLVHALSSWQQMQNLQKRYVKVQCCKVNRKEAVIPYMNILPASTSRV